MARDFRRFPAVDPLASPDFESPGVPRSLVAVGTPVARRPPHRFGRAAPPPSALGALSQLCVRSALRSGEFPLVGPLPSTASAAGFPALFGSFSGTTEPSDFPPPSVTGVRPRTSRCGLRPLSLPPADVGPPGSRAKCVRACSGSQTAQGPFASRAGDALGVAFRLSPRRRHPGVVQNFAARYPARTSPCPRFTPPSRATAHDSGPVWVATPSPYETPIRNTSPVLPAHGDMLETAFL